MVKNVTGYEGYFKLTVGTNAHNRAEAKQDLEEYGKLLKIKLEQQDPVNVKLMFVK